MSSIQTMFDQLESLDAVLATTSVTDDTTFEALLERRSQMISRIAAVFTARRQAIPAEQTALQQSYQAGAAALRQLLMARHLLASELSHLKQTQQLCDSVAAQAPPRKTKLSLDA